jgi:hypothetical protein
MDILSKQRKQPRQSRPIDQFGIARLILKNQPPLTRSIPRKVNNLGWRV